jgi:fused signal recognition particle receptor
MFEGIKETLGKFRSDVEEEAVEEEAVEEEAVEEDVPEEDVPKEPGADAPATDAGGDGTETGPPEKTPSEGGSTDGSTGESAPADAPENTANHDAGDVVPPGKEPPDTTGDPGGSDTAAADADDGETDSDDGGGATGISRRAKSLVRGRLVIDPEDLEGPLRDLELALLGHDVEMEVTDAILDRVREELVGETRKMTEGTTSVVEDALREALLSVLAVGQFDFAERIAEAEKPVVIVFTGVNGVGKTTTIAKLSRYLEERGYSSVLANGDTYRAGANEQIEEHADNLGRKCIAHEQGGDPAAVIYDAVEYAEANDVDVVLGDTAGRLHTDDDLMNQLAKIDRVVDPDLTLFVDEAVAGQDAVNRAREFDAAAEIDGAVLTKADADSSGGAAISVAHVTGKPILFLGVGQGYDDLEPFDPEELVERLLGE